MSEDLMKNTKADLIEMITALNKRLLAEKSKKKKQPGQNYPIQPITAFKDMGRLEYCRWRVNVVTHRIDTVKGIHDRLYIDSEKRYRVRMMKEFCSDFVELKKLDYKESEKFQKLNDKYLKDIESELKIIPNIPSVKLNNTGK